MSNLSKGSMTCSLDDDLTNRKPIGYKLRGHDDKKTSSWSSLLVSVCRHLAEQNPILFSKLVDDDEHVTPGGDPWFTYNKCMHTNSKEITEGVWIETCNNTIQKCELLKRILQAFGYNYMELRIFVNPIRDAILEISDKLGNLKAEDLL